MTKDEDEILWQREPAKRKRKSSKVVQKGSHQELGKQFIKCIPFLAHARVGSGPIERPSKFRQHVDAFLKSWDTPSYPLDQYDPSLFDVDDVKVRNPEETAQSLIQEKCHEIMSMPFVEAENEEERHKMRVQVAFDTEIPSFDSLCEPFRDLQENYMNNQVFSLRDKRRDLLRINAITRPMIERRALDVEKEKGISPVDPNEILLRIAIFDCKSKALSQEYLFLGSQYLSEVKDSIYCLSQQYYGKHFSPSGYFLIEDTFYDDLRPASPSTSAHSPFRYSDGIVEWAKKHNRYKLPGLSSYQQGDMSQIQLCELNLRLSALYLFCHLGNCQHVISVQEMRTLDAEDNLNRHLYPLLVYEPKIKRRRCGVCELYSAKAVVYGDKRAPQNPFLFCDSCFKLLHYDEEGALLYDDFKTFQYYHE